MRFLFLSFTVLTLVFTGCTSTSASKETNKFTADTVQSVRAGLTKDEVAKLLGEPRSRSLDNDGNEAWQYRQNAKTGKGVKRFSDIMSFGMTSDLDWQYQDLLTVTFKDGVVTKATYEENVNTASQVLGGQ